MVCRHTPRVHSHTHPSHSTRQRRGQRAKPAASRASPQLRAPTHGFIRAASTGGETEGRLGRPGRYLARVGGHRGWRTRYPGSAQDPGGSTGDRGRALGGKLCLNLSGVVGGCLRYAVELLFTKTTSLWVGVVERMRLSRCSVEPLSPTFS